uniref:Uncharacterized protein n=1 Tax=Toxocara canis TaxID=6265 RepID=A0A183VHG0_TOXCA
LDSSGDELDTEQTGRRRTAQRRHGAREQSLSPTVRRSPVSRKTLEHSTTVCAYTKVLVGISI